MDDDSMKRMILILLAALLCISFCAAEEDGAGGEETVLRFSSFAGGGYEYTCKVDDPSVVRCEAGYEYEEHAEEIDGASFDFIVSLTGLKPGSTSVTVYARSPILENADSIYTVTVDDALRITLTPVRALSSFFVYRSGEINYDFYQITREEDGYFVSVNEEPAQPVRADAAEALMRVIDTYDMVSWDGFSESRSFVLDGESFWLDFTLTDGTGIHAVGDNAYPAHYFDAMEEIWEILTGMTEEKSWLRRFFGI